MFSGSLLLKHFPISKGLKVWCNIPRTFVIKNFNMDNFLTLEKKQRATQPTHTQSLGQDWSEIVLWTNFCSLVCGKSKISVYWWTSKLLWCLKKIQWPWILSAWCTMHCITFFLLWIQKKVYNAKILFFLPAYKCWCSPAGHVHY